jgi:nucleoside-diphosphate-sugar epimerase
MATLFVAGASRRVGFETVQRLRGSGHRVVAMFRSTAERAKVDATGATSVIADAFDAAAVLAAVRGAGALDAVFCTIGGKPGDQPRVDYVGVKNCVDAAVACGIQRFLLVTAIGCGDTYETLEPKAQAFLKEALVAKNHAETYLRVSGLDYTILRPGHLLDEPASGSGFLTDERRALGSIARADVADLLVKSWQSARTRRGVFSAVDRARLRPSEPVSEVAL